MKQHFFGGRSALSLALVVTASFAPLAGVEAAGAHVQRRGAARPQNPVVQLTLHAELKESFTVSKETETEHYAGRAELTATQDFTVRRELYYEGGANWFRELPGDPGVTSGSFHYQSEDESRQKGGGALLWSHHKMDVASSLDPVGEVEVRPSGIAHGLAVLVSARAEGKPAGCSTEGNIGEDPHLCTMVGRPELSLTQVCGGTEKPRDQGSCVNFSLAYNLFPEPDPNVVAASPDSPDARRRKEGEEDSAEPYDAFALKDWYGAVSSGTGAGVYDLAFDGKRQYDVPERDGDKTREVGSKHLHVSVKVSGGAAARPATGSRAFPTATPPEDFSAEAPRLTQARRLSRLRASAVPGGGASRPRPMKTPTARWVCAAPPVGSRRIG